MKRIIWIIAVLCCIALSFGVLAINTPAKLPAKAPANAPAKAASSSNITLNTVEHVGNVTVLKQDSGTNFTKMNATLRIPPVISMAQAVEFKPPRPGWKLRGILVMATDGWNSSSKKDPVPLPFAIEIRDKDGGILYHYSDTQLGYFTHPKGEIKMASIEIPPLAVNNSFFICFYGYAQIHLLTEIQNATGNSYYFDRSTGQLYHAFIPARNNKTIPVNWIIRAAGE